MNIKADYLNPTTPSGYVCQTCGASGVKLWRSYGQFPPLELLCARCTAKSQKIDISMMDAEGTIVREGIPGRAYSIGWMVPALPVSEGGSWHGVISENPEAVIAWAWWRKLPNGPLI